MNVYRRLVYPYLVWMGIFIVIPMLLIVLYAFTAKSSNQVVSLRFTLENFQRFMDPVFLSILVKSLRLALVTTLLCLLIGYPLAYGITRRSEKAQAILILLVTLPMWINMLVRTYAWISLISDKGIINNLMSYFGLPAIQMMYTDGAVIMVMVYNFLPFMIIAIYTVLSKLDQSLVQASYDLGANRFQTFLRVIFPLSLSGVISGITMVFLPAVSTFVIPQLIGGGNYSMIGTFIEKQFINMGDWNFGSAISIVIAVIIMLSMQIANYFDKDPEDMQLKGRNL